MSVELQTKTANKMAGQHGENAQQFNTMEEVKERRAQEANLEQDGEITSDKSDTNIQCQ